MALKLPGQWVWDSWFAFDAGVHHAFYLQASRALGDPNRRHRNTSVGHSISADLKNWTVLRDALTPSESPAFDSWTTWTGSVVRHDGKWWMFYTGTSREDGGDIQTVGAATSDDLITWEKLSTQALVKADPTGLTYVTESNQDRDRLIGCTKNRDGRSVIVGVVDALP